MFVLLNATFLSKFNDTDNKVSSFARLVHLCWVARVPVVFFIDEWAMKVVFIFVVIAGIVSLSLLRSESEFGFLSLLWSF